MKILKNLLPFLVLIIIIFFTYSFFHIDGREIKNINKLNENCIVTVLVDKEDNQTEYQLSGKQIVKLRELLKGNQYQRRLSRTIIGVLPDTEYTILADWQNNRQLNLYIRIMGNEYMQISEQFGSNWHKIQNPEFETQLIAILNP